MLWDLPCLRDHWLSSAVVVELQPLDLLHSCLTAGVSSDFLAPVCSHHHTTCIVRSTWWWSVDFGHWLTKSNYLHTSGFPILCRVLANLSLVSDLRLLLRFSFGCWSSVHDYNRLLLISMHRLALVSTFYGYSLEFWWWETLLKCGCYFF